ncbi:hypothetical protein L21SP5_03301 [Salinivirga cyanobacteriivorans]|uniref:Uncharacterized protein n=1 Tax=Salinivirga cyanobacteriivorans TaxID=1307839 RepID=A0A0S2I3U4_9BACT|nr:hypothetical protein [Salinivirga cyanobacteriivorans]ALO16914.1 hypothetical protein L21SP5_03301 [Salinivirga cyanobacteriivorans]
MLYPVFISLLIAVIFAALLPSVFKREGPGPMSGSLFFFFIIFLFSWAVGSWITPIGPLFYGVPWLGYLIIGLFTMLLIAALVPAKPEKPETPFEQAEEEAEQARALGITFGFFFWTLMIVLLFAGIASLVF